MSLLADDFHRENTMKAKLLDEFATMLRRRRAALLQDKLETLPVADDVLESRESELEESAQRDRLARLKSRLDERGQIALRQIDDALERIESGTFGECERCGNDIGPHRLRAIPTAALCIECATALEKKQKVAGVQQDPERLPVKDDELDSNLAFD
jgi:RNA polymerase-binding transcription factor